MDPAAALLALADRVAELERGAGIIPAESVTDAQLADDYATAAEHTALAARVTALEA